MSVDSSAGTVLGHAVLPLCTKELMDYRDDILDRVRKKHERLQALRRARYGLDAKMTSVTVEIPELARDEAEQIATSVGVELDQVIAAAIYDYVRRLRSGE